MTWWLRTPTNWPAPVVAVGALLALTVLDLAGSSLAKEAVQRRSVPIAAAGAGLFVLMFWIFASTLAVANLVAVTVGWCVLVQIGVLLMDHFRYGSDLPAGKYVAVVVALAAQVYLLAGPSGESSARTLALPEPALAESNVTISTGFGTRGASGRNAGTAIQGPRMSERSAS